MAEKMRFRVTGMTCSACSARVGRAAESVAGVEKADVNLLTGTMDCVFSGTPDPGAVIAAVEKAGYGASLPSSGAPKTAPEENSGDRALLRRILWSLLFLLPLSYLAMFRMLPHPAFFDSLFGGGEGAMLWCLTQFLLCLPVLLLNKRYFTAGFRNLVRLSPNMDSLIALGSSVSAIYGVFSMLRIAYETGRGDLAAAESIAGNLYFESAAMILTLITVGKALEARSKRKTTEAIEALVRLAPPTALVLRDGKETEIPASELAVGDTVILKNGASVPCDGVVTEGCASLDQSAITGESIPVDKEPGDGVISASVCRGGYLKFRAERVGGDTTIAQVIRLVEEASAGKAPIARLADKISGIFVPAVIGIAILTFVIWMLCGAEFEFALRCGISVLVISCPCSLGLATPVAIMVGTGKGAGLGILIRSGEALETLGKVDTAVFDKTGTLTTGTPRVSDLILFGTDEGTLLSLAASLEQYSEHPLSGAIVGFAKEKGAPILPLEGFTAYPGKGVEAVGEDGVPLRIGNLRWLSSLGVKESELSEPLKELQEAGKTPVILVRGVEPLGILALSDTLRPTSAEAIEVLKEMKITPILLTGDNRRTAEAIASKLGIGTVISDVLPAQKEEIVSKLKAEGKVLAMIGDGTNDAPALVSAQVGIAIGAGTDAAIGSADAVLMHDDPMDVCDTVRLSRAVMKNIKENLFWAFFYNVIGIPLAAGVLYPAFGIQLVPTIGAAAMSLSSFCVVSNALRLRLFKPLPRKQSASLSDAESGEGIAVIEKQKGDTVMKKTMKIDGMMCEHCVAHVKKALSALDGAENVEVTLKTGTAVVGMSAEIPDGVLKKAVEDEGYTVLSIG